MSADVDDIPIVTEADHDEGDGESTTHVQVTIYQPDGRYVSGSATTPAAITDDEAARLLLRAALGAAAARSNDTWIALQLLLATDPRSAG